MKEMACAIVFFIFIAAGAFAGTIPDTGQVRCYGATGEIACPDPQLDFAGQDAQYVTTPRLFTKLDEQGIALPDTAQAWSMVRDTVTGLVWEVKNSRDGAEDFSNPHDSDNPYTWHDDNASRNGGDPGWPGQGTDTQDFISALNGGSFGGYADWRLPTAKELMWLLDRGGKTAPYIAADFFPAVDGEYWTATTDPSNAEQCATLTLKIGMMNYPPKSASFAAMAVRGQGAFQQLQDNGDGTISDLTTGLMWQKDSVQGISWKDSLEYCGNLDLGGQSDWRMPDVNELISLVRYENYSPSIDTNFFINTRLHYWSSTTYPDNPAKAYHVCFLRGRAETYAKIDASPASHIRAVRGGICATCPTTTTTTVRPCLINQLYGSDSKKAQLLRFYRDRVLAPTAPGRALTAWYYQFSSSTDRFFSMPYFQCGLKKCINMIITVVCPE